jgi:hypothetical protein
MQTKEKNRSRGRAFESREDLLLRLSNEAGNLNYILIRFAVAKEERLLVAASIANANKTTASYQLIGRPRRGLRLYHL